MSGTSPATLVTDVLNTTVNAGRGHWRSIPIPLTHLRTAANPPALLTGATTPPIVYTSKQLVVRVTNTTAVLIDTTIPWDAQTQDAASASPYTRGVEFMLVGSARIANAAETAILAASAYAQTRGTYSDSSDSTASTKAITAAITGAFKRLDIDTVGVNRRARTVSSTAFSQAANAVDLFCLDFSDDLDSGNLRAQPGDGLTIELAADGASAGNIDILSLSLLYRSNLRPTNGALNSY